jgi:hypothetical protein
MVMSGKITQEEEPSLKQQAFKLLDSMRGRYIVSQALYYGIQELERVPVPYQEVSNLADMKLLKAELFNFPVDDNSIAIAVAKKESLIE